MNLNKNELEREEWECRSAREHELALKQLELTAATPRDQTRGFCVESAVKLIPQFNEHDIESFLLSFEKIAELNAFPVINMQQCFEHI